MNPPNYGIILKKKLSRSGQPTAPSFTDLRTRGISIIVKLDEDIAGVEFQIEPFKTFMALKPGGIIEFKVPVSEAAVAFAKLVRKEWPQYCGCVEEVK